MPFFIKSNFKRNVISENFFSNYSRFHFFKFLDNHRLHGFLILLLLKIAYWVYFKTINRLKIEGKENILVKRKDYDGKAFLIVMNHASYNDVLMNYSIWAHLGYMTHTLTLRNAFEAEFPFYSMISHFIEMIPMIGSGEENVNRIVNTLIDDKIVTIFPAGSYPSGEYSNSGLVQEPFSGAARVAYNYWRRTGKELLIQPICSLGANKAYPPRRYRHWKKYMKKAKKNKKSDIKLKKSTAKKRSKPIPKTIAKAIPNHKIIIKFGEPFSLKYSDHLTYEEINEKKNEISMNIAKIWGQKHLVTNYKKRWLNNTYGVGKERKY